MHCKFEPSNVLLQSILYSYFYIYVMGQNKQNKLQRNSSFIINAQDILRDHSSVSMK